MYYWFSARTFSHLDLRNFSALANVHTLKLQHFEIYRCMPNIKLYFGHFSQTLRSIALFDPRGTPRQPSHFLSLFSDLDDVGIWGSPRLLSGTDPAVPDTTLVQFSVPKLRGRLTLRFFPWTATWTHLASYGGLRFRHMDLRWSTQCAHVLFEACASTLETLRFNAGDAVRGE